MNSLLYSENIVDFARGAKFVDFLLKGGTVVNVFTGETVPADVAIASGRIVGVSSGHAYQAELTIDCSGKFICPGFIDGHIHLESTLLSPYEFARAVVPRGTAAVICDPHEIANVFGSRGIEYLLDASENLPVEVFVMAPSCVPATHLEHSGASLGADDINALYRHPRVVGLAEMMNFPGVLAKFPDVVAKLRDAVSRGMIIDGHAPMVSGTDLQAYIASGISSDHECTGADEALEKLRAGMYVYIREGSTEHNLADLIPAVTAENNRRCLLVSDDRHPADLMDRGHLDYSLRLAVRNGLDPIAAIRMVTINPAERFRLSGRGAVGPGYIADLVILDDLTDFRVSTVFHGGRITYEDGETFFLKPSAQKIQLPPSVRIPMDSLDFRIEARGEKIRTIEILEGQIITGAIELPVKEKDGFAVADPERDILKMAVVERHHNTGRTGLGFVRGIGIRKGAISGSVAHDSHNIITAGTDDSDMLKAVATIVDMQGGFAVVSEGNVLAALPLPIAGLLSPATLEEVRQGMDRLNEAAGDLGCRLRDPFMALSFLALPVIPDLKLTDMGLVDVTSFEIVPLFV
ncbi:MAG TPA: adenine deaminase [Thermodesulfobacteriaceae bacterium]|nr:adenine deaminase [Thermodesulfobacteriaceae bacterium]